MEIALGIIIAIVLLPLVWRAAIFLIAVVILPIIFLPILAVGWCIVAAERAVKQLRRLPLL